MDQLALKIPGYNFQPAKGVPEGGTNTLRALISWGITVFFIIIVFATLIYLIWGGIQWIVSQGEKDKIEAARRKIVYAVIGLVIAFSSYLIINTILQFFGLTG